MTKKLSLLGETYGRLTVAEEAPSAKGKTRWLCHCECGNTMTVTTGHLRNGITRSCGCLKRERNISRSVDLLGRVFGELEVVRHIVNQSGASQWLCKCSCGTERAFVASVLTSGRYTDCGCKDKRAAAIREHIKRDSIDGTRKTALTSKLHVHNSSGVKGVWFNQRRGKWIAYIGFRGKQIRLGYYNQFEDAVAARKTAEEKYFAPFLIP